MVVISPIFHGLSYIDGDISDVGIRTPARIIYYFFLYLLSIFDGGTINPRNAAMMAVVALAGILLFSLGR